MNRVVMRIRKHIEGWAQQQIYNVRIATVKQLNDLSQAPEFQMDAFRIYILSPTSKG